ncbi:hypothetical protein ACFL2R_00185 [Patescibacteria group bacterium]
MKSILLVVMFTVMTLALSGCSKKVWTAYYYPGDGGIYDPDTWKIQTGFNSLDECRVWIVKTANGDTDYDYECGYSCRYEDGLSICDEARR